MQNADLTKKRNIVTHKNLLSQIKMGKETLTFGDIEIDNFFFTAMTPIFLKRCKYWKVLVPIEDFFWWIKL